MARKIRVLEVNVDDQGNGGVFSLIKSVIEKKPDDMQIDIAALEPFEKKENIKYLRSLGTRIFFVGYKGSKIKKQFYIYKHMCSLLKQERYDVVHIHSDVANKLLVSGLAAKRCGVPKILLHSHATGTDGNNREIKEKLHLICRKLLKIINGKYVACSYSASKWMFPGIPKTGVTLIKNGIDIEKFAFNENIRKKVRAELDIDNSDYLIGHVGRFMYQKNHEYVIKIFSDFCESWKKHGCEGDTKLLLVGAGELIANIKKIVKDKGLDDNVIFYGLSDRVNELLQGMDVFILPSFFEGLPIVGIEAQAAGLPVLLSDTITKEAALTENAVFLPIDDGSIYRWSEKLMYSKKYIRKNMSSLIEKKGYSIEATVGQLIDFYKNK